MPIPTVMKKTPISRPRNGSIISSTSCLNSVSANSRPAIRAPSAIDSPAAALMPAMPSVLNKISAMNTSGWWRRAKARNSGRITRPPTR
jgi:hypothetical protein